MTESRTTFNLAALIWADLSQHLLAILLFIAVVTSAIGVILSTHHNRQLLIEHERLMSQRDELDVEWRHLVLEQGALTEHNRIENLVAESLAMKRPGDKDEIVVRVK